MKKIDSKVVIGSLGLMILTLFGSSFSDSAEVSMSPNIATLSCHDTYDFNINMNTSGYNVLASDIKFFLEGFDFISVQNHTGFDHLNYVGTGVSTKGSDTGKVYHYINVYQNTFGDFVSGVSIPVAKITLSPKLGFTTGSIVFYNLLLNDEDSNISVGTGLGLNSMPLKYNDVLDSVINGYYNFGNCLTGGAGSNGGGGGGGGGSNLIMDNCCINGGLPGGNAECKDLSDHYYDGTCVGGYHGSADICGVNQSKHTDELKLAYLYAYKNGITTMCPIEDADLDGYLYRNHFAKMISEYAVNVLGKKPNIGKKGCEDFGDMNTDTKEMQYFMKTACELNLMGMRPDGETPNKNFDPHLIVTRAEFGTVFSRLLFGYKYNIPDESLVYKNEGFWYKDHLNALKDNGIMTKIDGDWPKYQERRGWVMLMMLRADKYGLFAGKIPALLGVKALFE